MQIKLQEITSQNVLLRAYMLQTKKQLKKALFLAVMMSSCLHKRFNPMIGLILYIPIQWNTLVLQQNKFIVQPLSLLDHLLKPSQNQQNGLFFFLFFGL